MKPTTIKDTAGDNTYMATSAAEVFVFNTRDPGLNVVNDFEWGVDQVRFTGGKPGGFGFVSMLTDPMIGESKSWDGGHIEVNYLTPVPLSDWITIL